MVTKGLHAALNFMQEVGSPAAVRQFGTALNATRIDAALRETGKATARKRRLPAPAVWLVITVALFRHCSRSSVVAPLGLMVHGSKGIKATSSRSFAGSAVARAVNDLVTNRSRRSSKGPLRPELRTIRTLPSGVFGRRRQRA